MDRRTFIAISTTAILSFTLAPMFQPAFGSTARLDEELQKRLGVRLAQIREVPDIKITAPTIAESGANVPITVEATIPIDRVEHLWIFVDKNPIPWIADVRLTPMNGQVFFSTRIKMGETSNVRAIVKLKDGSYVMATKEVKVTAGGCG